MPLHRSLRLGLPLLRYALLHLPRVLRIGRELDQATRRIQNSPEFQESVRAYYTSWYRDLVTVMPRIENGFIYPLEGPGLGLELSEGLLADPDIVVLRTDASSL